jgi:opacity protein-like surface antigen
MGRWALITAASASVMMLAVRESLADGLAPQNVEAPAFSWRGLYVGFHGGANAGTAQVSDPFGASIFGDSIRSSGGLFGGQIGANLQAGSAVFGIEADSSFTELTGSATCFAYSGFFISADCRARTDVLGTLTGRLGIAAGPEGRTLVYAKGGAAWEHLTVDATTNGDLGLGLGSTSSSAWRFGWTAGAGIEHALTGNWSIRAEYDYLAFGSAKVVTPASLLQTVPGNPGTLVAVPANVASASQDLHEFKVGLNYRFASDPAGPSPLIANAGHMLGWAYEVGARYWASTSRFQKDIDTPSLISRITFDGVADRSGELIARADAPSNFFIKGFAGIGSTHSGHMNDEDWGIPADPADGILAFVPYSNALQRRVEGGLQYGTVDMGYSWVRAPDIRAGSFLGLNVLNENMDSYGCVQLANPNGPCGNAVFPNFPTSVPNIFQHNVWWSLRLGAELEYAITDRLKFSADAAYLPFVLSHGTDDHYSLASGGAVVAKQFSEWGYGRGVQLEAVLSFALTDQFILGAGARYWSMWTSDSLPSIFNVPSQGTNVYRTEATGLFVQASYKFGEGCCTSSLK